MHADEEHLIDTDHSGLNKCSGTNDELYKKLTGAIKQLRTPSLLEQADGFIRQRHYTADRLKIQRFANKPLAMDQCYINLAIVKHSDLNSSTVEEMMTKSHDNFLLRESTPQNTSATDQTATFDLQALFNERVGQNNQIIRPRRIMIRGRPGVGKTTMCKKIVHDFERGMWADWNKLFDRVLWVPLRNLKLPERLNISGYNLEKLFGDEYFSLGMRDDLARELSLEVERNASRTLFLLDGLDELSQYLMGGSSMANFLAKLLKQPSVIITSRPCVKPPPDLDLDLDTIGFYHEQVIKYVREIAGQDADDIQSFLQKNSLIQGLARIPIQLDALCYAWQDVNPKDVPKTMTAVYKMIEDRLWKKDVILLENSSECLYLPTEIRCRVGDEIALLELLAFNGLHQDIVDFTPAHRDKFVTRFSKLHFSFDKTLERLSFLRTSDPSSRPECRNYHFIHLTFQEYFAALYFVRQWTAEKGLEVLPLGNGNERNSISTVEFLRKHKYTVHYEIFWRFVAGLLDRDGRAQAFIKKVEEEPLDLLGPTHQRVVMRCLSEICGNLPMRQGLEQRLSRWLLFECRIYESSWLAREAEFPEQVLETALSNESPAIRAAILDAVNDRATISSNMIEQATILVSDEDMLVREAAVKFIGRQSSLSETMLASIIERLNDKEPRVQIAAIEILESQPVLPDKAFKAMSKLCSAVDISTRAAAFNALGKLSALPDEIIDTVWDFFKVTDRFQRIRIPQAAIKTLVARTALPNKIFIAFLAKLGDENDTIRRAAVAVLGGQRALPHKVLMGVIARLDSQDRRIRDDAIEIIGRRASLPNKIFKAMIKRLDNKDSHIQYAAIQVLRQRADWPYKVHTAIIKRLDPTNSHVQYAAIQVLGSRRVLPDPIVETLVDLLRNAQMSPGSRIQNAAIEALGNQKWLPDSALSVIKARLTDEELQKAAISALSMRSSLPRDIRETMSALVSDKDKDSDARVCTIYALPWQSIPPTEALVLLANQLKDNDDEICHRASYALLVLSRQFSLPRDVHLALLPLVNDDYDVVRYTAICALGKQDLQDMELQEFVTRVNRETYESLRIPIINALRGQSALPFQGSSFIVGLLHDSNFRVRHAASEAVIRKHEVFCFSSQVDGIDSLYRTLLERSLQEQISFCIEEDKVSIHMPDGALEYPCEDETWLKMLKQDIRRARRAGMPSISSVEISSDD